MSSSIRMEIRFRTDSWTSGDSFPQSGTATIGDTVDKDNLTPALPNTVQPAGTNNNYVFVSCTKCTITAETDENVITVTYALDNWDDKDDSETGGDGTPDYRRWTSRRMAVTARTSPLTPLPQQKRATPSTTGLSLAMRHPGTPL